MNNLPKILTSLIVSASLCWASVLNAEPVRHLTALPHATKIAGDAPPSHGNLQFSANGLNLTMAGEGLLVLGGSTWEPAGAISYARDGTFHVDDNGYLVNESNKPLLAYRPNDQKDATAGFRNGVRDAVKVNTNQTIPSATTEIKLSLNLDAREIPPKVSRFSTLDPNSYNYAVSTNVFDSKGRQHTVTSYFVKTSPEEIAPQAVDVNGNPISGAVWKMYVDVDNLGNLSIGGEAPTGTPLSSTDGGAPTAPIYLEFYISGYLVPPALGDNESNNSLTTPTVTIEGEPLHPPTPGPNIYFTPTSGAAPMNFSIDVSGSTQFGKPNRINHLSQNGYAIAKLTGLAVDDCGVIYARYTSGFDRELRVLGKLALAKFKNPKGLLSLGGAEWAESTASGAPLFGEAYIRQVWQAAFRRF